MSEGRHAFLAAALLVTAAVVASPVSIEAERLRLPPPSPLAGLTGRIPAAFSVRRFAALRSWIDTLQYCGDVSFVIERGRRLLRMSGETTDLDPRFEQAYAYGGAMLMWQCKRPEEAATLLRKGIAYNPGAVQLKYYLAAFTYNQAKDLAREVAVLETLAAEPSAPFILRRILANLYEKQGRIDRAAAIWGLVLLTSGNPDERRWAGVKCAKHRIDPARFTIRRPAVRHK